MQRLLLPAICLGSMLSVLSAGGCDSATSPTAASTTRCLKITSPIARMGFVIVSDLGLSITYDFDSTAQVADYREVAEIESGFGPTRVNCGRTVVVTTGDRCDTVYVAIKLTFRGTAPGTFLWEEGSGSSSGATVTITGGPHGGSYLPISGASEIRRVEMGPAGGGHDIVEASFCGTLRGVNGGVLTIRGGRVKVE